jgi:hypothetical protein
MSVLHTFTEGLLQQQLSWLSEEQIRRLDGISRGTLSRSDVEIVLARYDEDISWSDMYADVRTVYCKGDIDCDPDWHKLPNVGREGHTYLHHIVENYDMLADWTVFSQAAIPEIGYSGQDGLGHGHYMPGSSFHDYVLAEGRADYFQITSVVNLVDFSHKIRRPFSHGEDAEFSSLGPASHKLRQCPLEQAGDADRWSKWTEASFLQRFLMDMASEQETLQKPSKSLLQYWSDHVGKLPPGSLAFYSQGATFAVSKQQILARSKDEYQVLLNEGAT